MNNNLSIQSYNTNFKANISGKLLDAADCYYKQTKQDREYKLFCLAIRRYLSIPNSDNLTLGYKKIYDSQNNAYHLLIASDAQTGSNTILTCKDKFRKLLTKFSRMNEYEFKLKTGLLKKF